MKINAVKNIIIKLLMEYLEDNGLLPILSLAGANHLIKKILKYSFKKAHKIPK